MPEVAQRLGAIGDCESLAHRFCGLGIAVVFDWLAIQFGKLALEIREHDPILWTFRTGDAGLYFSQIQFKYLAVLALTFARNAEHTLGFEVVAEGFYLFVGAPSSAEIFASLFINWEEAHRRAIFRCHIGNRRPVSEW